MAKILSFRNKDGAPSGQDFLTDANQTLSFRTTEDGGISLGDMSHSGLSGLFPDPKKDWSNQELADLFRVRQLLSSANVPVETDRGVTDEGDPWFVFCHANGEVFIHLCRIEGAYILDSPNVLRPLRGADFNELIADFTNQALPAPGNDEDPERRVIRLERGGKVRLHPSAMLAALIWTLFLASEELVLLAPEEPEADNDKLLDFEGMFSVSASDKLTSDQIFAETDLELSNLVKDSEINPNEEVFDTHSSIREAQLHQQQGLILNNNAFTMGLSTIAIAMGFMSETTLLDDPLQNLDDLEILGLSQTLLEQGEMEHIQISADEGSGRLLEMLADFLGLELSSPNKQVVDANTRDTAALVLEQDLSLLDKAAVTNQYFLGIAKNTAPVTVKKQPEAERAEDSVADELNQFLNLPETASKDANAASTDGNSASALLSSIMLAHQVEREAIQVADGTIWLSFDANKQQAFELFDWVDIQPDIFEKERELGDFEVIAQRMMEFLEKKTANIGMIELSSGSGIIFIDREAVVSGNVDHMHWEASDGKIISLIGFETDLQQFDMIA